MSYILNVNILNFRDLDSTLPLSGGWEVAGQMVKREMWMEYFMNILFYFNNSRNLIEKIYTLYGLDYKFLNYRNLFEN